MEETPFAAGVVCGGAHDDGGTVHGSASAAAADGAEEWQEVRAAVVGARDVDHIGHLGDERVEVTVVAVAVLGVVDAEHAAELGELHRARRKE